MLLVSSQKMWFERLRRCNIAASVLHSIWAILILVVALNPKLGSPFTLRFEKFMSQTDVQSLPPFLKTNQCNGTSYENVFEWFSCVRSGGTGGSTDLINDEASARLYKLEPTLIYEVYFRGLLFLFECLTAMSHGCIAFYRELYEEWLRMKIQPLRWIEYSVTSSIMLLALFSLSRISDIYILFSMFLLSVFLNLTGGLVFELFLCVEYDLKPKAQLRSLLTFTRWILFSLAWIAFILHYALIFDAYNTAISPYMTLPNRELWGQLWDFISILNYLILIAYASFPIIHIAQTLTRHKEQAYYQCEFAYIICSFVAKTILTMVIFVASIQRAE